MNCVFFKAATNINVTFKGAFPPGILSIIADLVWKTQSINVLEMKFNPKASIKIVTPLNLLDIEQV